MVIECLVYDEVDKWYDVDIFIVSQICQDFLWVMVKFKNYVYDYVIMDFDVEKVFVQELDISSEVVVYVKLLCGFLILIFVGDYNFDWVIFFKVGSV